MPHKDKKQAREYFTNRKRLLNDIPLDGYPEKECYSCGSAFKPRTKVQINCSQACYQKSRNKLEYQRDYTRKRSSDDPRFFLASLLTAKERWKTLTLDDLIELWNSQKGICALSGQQMTHIYGHGKILTNVSIDRLTHGGPYTKDNIRLVCNIVNTMRHSMSDDELLNWCKILINNNKETLNG